MNSMYGAESGKSRPVPDCEVELIRVDGLTIQMENIWRQLRESSRQFASPYYDLEFLRAVARVRKDVEIAVLRNTTREIVGFFPFQRTRRSHAEPVGGRLNDVHGILGQNGYLFEIREVLQKCGISSFAFHALANPPVDVAEFEFDKLDAHYIDLSEGWDSYCDAMRRNSNTIKKQGQKTRALEREFGPVRFEFDCMDPEALEDVIALKRSKYVRSRTFSLSSMGVEFAERAAFCFQ